LGGYGREPLKHQILLERRVDAGALLGPDEIEHFTFEPQPS
jgi:hypothetical protein